jgi:hypothetical protein
MDPTVNSSTLCVLGVGRRGGALSEGATKRRARDSRSALFFSALFRPGPRAAGRMGLGGEKHAGVKSTRKIGRRALVGGRDETTNARLAKRAFIQRAFSPGAKGRG